MYKGLLSLQHLLAMAGATILVPLLVGIPPSVALFSSGIGTILFVLLTDKKVPAYLGSSFAFIAPMITAKSLYGREGIIVGVIGAGLVYILVSVLISKLGTDFIKKLLPPVVIGPIIILIGLLLAPVAKDMVMEDWVTAIFTLVVMIGLTLSKTKLLRIIPIVLALFAGYVFALIRGIVDISLIAEAGWVELPDLVFLSLSSLEFSIFSLSVIMPVALVTIIEHVGDITAIKEITGRDILKEPGLHKTLLGDGVATIFAGLVGSVPNTTYGENIGVLELTRKYDTKIIIGAGIMAVLVSFIGKVNAFLMSIPAAVMGGIVFILFGLITVVGLKTLIQNSVELSDKKNMIIVAVILVLGLSGLTIQSGNFVLEGLSLAAIAGIILNYVFNHLLK